MAILAFPHPADSAPRVAHQWSQVAAGDGHVEVLTVGDGDPLLFLHGWGLTPRAYLAGLNALAAHGHRVIAPSLPGFGRSTALTPRRQTVTGVAEHIITVIDTLGLARSVPVVAHSFGAGVALRVAATRPDLVAALTAICPVGGAGAGPVSWPDLIGGMIADLDLAVVAKTIRDFVPAALRNPLAVAASGLSARHADLIADTRRACAAGVPVHLVFADSDTVVRRGDLPTCAPDIRTETVDGHHAWLLHQPERFADVVRGVLTDLLPAA